MSVPSPAQSFSFTDGHFKELSKLVYEHTGIVLSDAKKDLTYSRFVRRIRAQKLSGFEEYLKLLRAGDALEINAIPSIISTNVTSFYREPHHFTFLADEFANQRILSDKNRVRIWSSACSTGEEPYSIAACLTPALTQRTPRDFKILATDIDPEALFKGQQGIYREQTLQKMPPAMRGEFFNRTTNGDYQVSEKLRKWVHFKRLNLLRSWPMKGPFDLIFCRNVVIYFDEPTKKKLYQRFAELQRPGDYLVVGHSESLLDLTTDYECLGKTVWVRK
ncbi:MAG: protein-glutamate O-methyltransferase CheR [Pseudomonadota bacterium]